MQREILELYAFANELVHDDMEQEFIDEVARQVREGKEELYAAIQLFSTSCSEHSWAFRFQQVEKLAPDLVNFEIAHYYTYGSNWPDFRYYIEKPPTKYAKYYYFDFMVWFYFVKGIVFEYNNKLFMKITEEYNQKKYYFGDKITVDEYYDTMLNKYRKDWPDDMKDYINNVRRKEDKQREQFGEISGFVRNPFIREYAIPITRDIIVVETPVLTSCIDFDPCDEKEPVKIYHGHKYDPLG